MDGGKWSVVGEAGWVPKDRPRTGEDRIAAQATEAGETERVGVGDGGDERQSAGHDNGSNECHTDRKLGEREKRRNRTRTHQ